MTEPDSIDNPNCLYLKAPRQLIQAVLALVFQVELLSKPLVFKPTLGVLDTLTLF